MPDLQQVHRLEPAAHERRLDRRLGIAGEQGGEPAAPENEHDRPVVDVALGKRQGRIALGGVEHLDRGDGVERQRRAGAGETDRDAGIGRIGQQAVVRGVLEADAGMEQCPDLEAIEHLDEPRDVVLVRMAEHHQVDPSGVEWQVRAEPSQCELRVGPAVDEHRSAVCGPHEDGIALADVEGGDV